MSLLIPYIPETITVHLGAPDSPAENITVPFTDYIKNVASGEIYPTWPDSALRANIYAIITFALNRIFTEYYRARGYNFDITSSTRFDQSYAKNREVFTNISKIVDEIFNSYIVRQGEFQPLFAQFCNGTTSKCNGLSQWGTVDLANRGLTPYEILQYYYGDNINIVNDAPVQAVAESYPGTPLSMGSAGNDVLIIQRQLNRIAQNYPAIPKIASPNGVFDGPTRDSVKKFQEIFQLTPNGTVDKSTWYRIKQYYNGVKSLSELTSEGLLYDDVALLYSDNLSFGMSGYPVGVLQYYLNVIAYFNPNLSNFPITYIFDEATQNAVDNFQMLFGLEQTGVIRRADWNKITEIYDDILKTVPEGYSGNYAKLYPGYALAFGARGEDVRNLQNYLNTIAINSGIVPYIEPDGIFGNNTRDAVYTFQNAEGLKVTGVVGPLTWQRIARRHDEIINGKN